MHVGKLYSMHVHVETVIDCLHVMPLAKLWTEILIFTFYILVNQLM